MIVSEILGDKFIRHYSDNGKKIRQVETGVVYDEAVDVFPCRYTYTETDEPADGYTDDATEADYQSALREMGVDV